MAELNVRTLLNWITLHNCKAEATERTGACGHRYNLNETHRRLKVLSRNVPKPPSTLTIAWISATRICRYSRYVSQAGFSSCMKTPFNETRTYRDRGKRKRHVSILDLLLLLLKRMVIRLGRVAYAVARTNWETFHKETWKVCNHIEK